jgi:hypothetical protein
MAIVIHEIKGHKYAYRHQREGKKVNCFYLGPVHTRVKPGSIKEKDLKLRKTFVSPMKGYKGSAKKIDNEQVKLGLGTVNLIKKEVSQPK